MEYQTRVYRLQNVSAERIDKLVRGLVSGEDADKAIETTIDGDGNLLIVRASAEVHRQVELLLKELDRPVDSAESPIQFYKLRNANAIEVLYSLLALQEVTGGGQVAQVRRTRPGSVWHARWRQCRPVRQALVPVGWSPGYQCRCGFRLITETATNRSRSLPELTRTGRLSAADRRGVAGSAEDWGPGWASGGTRLRGGFCRWAGRRSWRWPGRDVARWGAGFGRCGHE